MAKQLSQLVDMFSTHLDSEDHQDQTAAGFLKELDNVLDAQHRKLANPSLQSQEIEEIVFDLLEFADDDGSVGQRLNRQYLLARCSYLQHMERREHKRKAKRQSQRKPPDEVENDTSIDATIDTAINRFANAIQLAGELADHLSLVALHFWLAKCYHQKSDHDRAYEEYAAAEQSLPQLSSNPSDPSFASALLAMRFTLNLRMASHEWERGRFSSGEQHIGVAHALLSQAQNSPALSHDKLLIENVLKEAFQVYWITSLFDYVGGRFIHAYRAGLLARDALSPETNPTNMGRCLRMVAEYRMNLVAAQCSFDPVDYPAFRLPGALQDSVEELDRTDEFMIAPLMDAAHKELKDAIAYARAGKDNTGRALVELAMRRAARLTSLIKRLNTYAPDTTLEVADRIISQAREKHDPSLEGRAIMVRGDAFLMQDKYQQAYDEYEKAFALFTEHSLLGLRFWAEQTLRAVRPKLSYSKKENKQ